MTQQLGQLDFSSATQSGQNSLRTSLTLPSPSLIPRQGSNIQKDNLSVRSLIQLINEYSCCVDVYLDSKNQIDYLKLMHNKSMLNKQLSKMASMEIVQKYSDSELVPTTPESKCETPSNKWKAEKQELERRIEELQEQIDSKQRNLHEQEVNTSQEPRSNSQSRFSFLVKPFTQRQGQQKEQSSYELNNTIRTLESKLKKSASTIQSLEEQNTKLTKQLSSVNNHLSEMLKLSYPSIEKLSTERMLSLLKEHLALQTEQISVGEKLQVEIFDKMKDVQVELNSLLSEISVLKEQNKLLLSNEQQLEQDLERQKIKYQKNIQQLSQQLDQRENRITNLQIQLEQQSQDVEPVLKHFQTLLSALDHIRNEHLTLVAEMMQIKVNCDSKQQQNMEVLNNNDGIKV